MNRFQLIEALYGGYVLALPGNSLLQILATPGTTIKLQQCPNCAQHIDLFINDEEVGFAASHSTARWLLDDLFPHFSEERRASLMDQLNRMHDWPDYVELELDDSGELRERRHPEDDREDGEVMVIMIDLMLPLGFF